jgi:ferredoxin
MDRWLDLTETAMRALKPGLPELDPARCLPSRHAGSSCDACFDVCPRAALGGGPVPRPEVGGCDGCSACVAACPSGALASVARDEAITRWLDATGARSSGNGPFPASVTCERAGTLGVASPGPAGSVLRLPCLGALRAADLVGAVARGAGSVTLIAGDCASCVRVTAGRAAAVLAIAARSALATLGGPATLAWDERPGAGSEPTSAASLPAREAVTRRELLRAWREPARRAMSGVLRENESAPLRVARQGRAPAWRRRLEADVVTIGAAAGSAGGPLPRELGLGLPTVLGPCDGCGLCAMVCPLAAISVEGSSVVCRPGTCTACGLCVEVCPTRGLAIVDLDSRAIVAAAAQAAAGAPPMAGAGTSAPELIPVGSVSAASLASRAGSTDRGMRDYALQVKATSPRGDGSASARDHGIAVAGPHHGGDGS